MIDRGTMKRPTWQSVQRQNEEEPGLVDQSLRLDSERSAREQAFKHSIQVSFGPSRRRQGSHVSRLSVRWRKRAPREHSLCIVKLCENLKCRCSRHAMALVLPVKIPRIRSLIGEADGLKRLACGGKREDLRERGTVVLFATPLIVVFTTKSFISTGEYQGSVLIMTPRITTTAIR